ncbi:hypothetical protein [Microbulbifer litoralis]|uniref:hypothetical protein n=1 Tax=Microbulbifer litoralis TaxID=2933965 RepID=UPI002028376B|nr:hypothetical protein [Microbulbifer sp. GX H0434]
MNNRKGALAWRPGGKLQRNYGEKWQLRCSLVGRSQSQVTVRFAKSSSSALRKLEITLLFQRFLALT